MGFCTTIFIIGANGTTIIIANGTIPSSGTSGNTIVCGTDGITYTINELRSAQIVKSSLKEKQLNSSTRMINNFYMHNFTSQEIINSFFRCWN